MTKINAALQKPNPKGAPPTPAATPDNLLRPVIGENVPFQVRIPPQPSASLRPTPPLGISMPATYF